MKRIVLLIVALIFVLPVIMPAPATTDAGAPTQYSYEKAWFCFTVQIHNYEHMTDGQVWVHIEGYPRPYVVIGGAIRLYSHYFDFNWSEVSPDYQHSGRVYTYVQLVENNRIRPEMVAIYNPWRMVSIERCTEEELLDQEEEEESPPRLNDDSPVSPVAVFDMAEEGTDTLHIYSIDPVTNQGVFSFALDYAEIQEYVTLAADAEENMLVAEGDNVAFYVLYTGVCQINSTYPDGTLYEYIFPCPEVTAEE